MSWVYYHTVWSVMMFAWITNYMVRAGLSPVLISIMDELSISYSNAGLIASALFYAYALMGLPGGFIGDRWGRKKVLVGCGLAWAVFSFLTGVASSFFSLVTFRFLTGVSQGIYFSNDRPVIAFYTPREKAGLGQGVSFIGLGLGMFFGISLAGPIAESFGWRWVFIIYSIPSALSALLILKLIKEPSRPAASQSTASPVHCSTGALLRITFASKDLWLIYLAGIAATYALWMLGAWAPAMFKEIGMTGLSRASLYASMIGLSAIPGLALSGWATDYLYRRGVGRKAVLSIDFFCACIILAALGSAVSLRVSYVTLAALVFLSGFFLWGLWAPLFSSLAELVPPAVLGTAFGANCTINFIGGLLSPWLTGIIKDQTGSFSAGCHLASILLAAAVLLVLMIKPSFRFKRQSVPPSGSESIL
jgi:MFS family permease